MTIILAFCTFLFLVAAASSLYDGSPTDAAQWLCGAVLSFVGMVALWK
jgi:hypothetical protein